MARAAARRLGKGGEDKEGFGHFGHSNSSLPTDPTDPFYLATDSWRVRVRMLKGTIHK